MARILAAVALLLAGNGLVITALPVRWTGEGLGSATIAALGSAAYLGLLAGAAAAPSLVAGLGARVSAGLFALLFAGSSLALGLHPPPETLAVLRVAGGFGLAGLTLLIEGGLNALAAGGKRGRMLALYMTVFYLSQAAGAAASDAADSPLALAAAAILLSAPLLAGIPVSVPANGAGQLGRIVRLEPRATVAGFSAGVLLGCFYALAPLRTPDAPGAVLAAAMIGGVAGLWPLGAAADRFGAMPVLAMVNLAVAAVSGWMVAGPAVSPGAAFAFGLVGFSCYPLASAALNRAVPAGDRLTANGLLILVSGLGGCLGPLTAGALVPVLGPASVFVVIGLSAVATGLVLDVLAPVRRPR